MTPLLMHTGVGAEFAREITNLRKKLITGGWR